MVRLRFAGESRRCRRMGPSARSGRLDLRRTVRAALRTGGETLSRRYLEPGERPRRLVLLLDVSGSMEAYARALIRFVHAVIVGRRDVEAFALGTRLTRLTRELSTRDPDAALARAAEAVTDWSGGTRLGDGLRLFNDGWGVRGMARGAVVVVLSDGWDRGDPAVMSEQMQRLSRVAHKVVWVNPLKAAPATPPRPGHGRCTAPRRRVPRGPQPRQPRSPGQGHHGRVGTRPAPCPGVVGTVGAAELSPCSADPQRCR